MLEKWLAQIAHNAIQAGDTSRLDALINRTAIGPVTNKVEQSGTSTVITKYASMTDEEIEEKLKELLWNGEKK